MHGHFLSGYAPRIGRQALRKRAQGCCASEAGGQGALTAAASEASTFHHVIYARRASLTRTNNMMENRL